MELTPLQYFTLRNNIAGDIRRGMCQPTPDAIAASVRSGAGVTASTAADFTERFFDDLSRHAGNGLKR
jgi:hypothetical protein